MRPLVLLAADATCSVKTAEFAVLYPMIASFLPPNALITSALRDVNSVWMFLVFAFCMPK